MNTLYTPQNVRTGSTSSEALVEQTGSGGASLPFDSPPGDPVYGVAEERRRGTEPLQPPKGESDAEAVA